MNADFADIASMRALPLHLGPLKYHLHAHDSWGEQVLDNIARHISPPSETSTPDRIIHLVHDKLAVNAHLSERRLSVELSKYLPDDGDQSDWQIQRNHINTICTNSRSRHIFWTTTASSSIGPIRFHLPWGLIISDMVNHGGGLLHCGLACHEDSGVLFLAPPSGGKSTTLSTAPPDWQVLSDDAALTWTDSSGAWFASPLPAWGNMIKPKEEWQYPNLALDRCCRIKSLLMIKKADSISLKRLRSSAVVPSLYQAMCEYPATITAEAIQQEAFFRSAAALSRELPGWQLSLPRHGNIWPLLVEEAA